MKIDIFNKCNIVKEILYFYQELCVSENERNEKKKTKNQNQNIETCLSHIDKIRKLIMKTQNY